MILKYQFIAQSYNYSDHIKKRFKIAALKTL